MLAADRRRGQGEDAEDGRIHAEDARPDGDLDPNVRTAFLVLGRIPLDEEIDGDVEQQHDRPQPDEHKSHAREVAGEFDVLEVVAEVLGEVGGVLIALGGFLAQTLHADAIDLAADAGLPLAGRDRLLADGPFEEVHLRLARPRRDGRLADEHLVEGRAQPIDVAGSGRLAGDLFGGDVGERPRDPVGLSGARSRGVVDDGESEVSQQGDVGVRVDEDVVRLDVAVDHAVTVRLGEGAGDSAQVADGVGLLQALADTIGEGAAALDQFHDVERPAPVLAEGEDADAVGMAEPGGGPDLDEELRHRLRAAPVRPQHLQGDQLLGALLPRLVDDAHAAAPQFREDFVALQLGERGRLAAQGMTDGSGQRLEAVGRVQQRGQPVGEVAVAVEEGAAVHRLAPVAPILVVHESLEQRVGRLVDGRFGEVHGFGPSSSSRRCRPR
jgi:hypothetical protein